MPSHRRWIVSHMLITLSAVTHCWLGLWRPPPTPTFVKSPVAPNTAYLGRHSYLLFHGRRRSGQTEILRVRQNCRFGMNLYVFNCLSPACHMRSATVTPFLVSLTRISDIFDFKNVKLWQTSSPVKARGSYQVRLHSFNASYRVA